MSRILVAVASMAKNLLVMFRLYAHVVPQSQRRAVDALAGLVGGGQLLIEPRNADSVERKAFVS